MMTPVEPKKLLAEVRWVNRAISCSTRAPFIAEGIALLNNALRRMEAHMTR